MGLVAVATLASFGGNALAGADPGLLPTEGEVKKEEKKNDGWDPALSVGASIALGSNSNVIGQVDGTSWTIGFNLLGRLDYTKDVHDWRNTLKLNLVYSRTPAIDEWIKAVDTIEYESVYYYKISEMFGPFAMFKLQSSIFSGHDVRGAESTYVSAADASVIEADTTSLRLTDAFQPMTLKQSLGVFVRPISTKPIEVDIRAGFGAAETFAEGGRFINDDGATPDTIEVGDLKDFVQAGAVVGVEAKGELEEGRVAWGAHAEVMIPFINDDAAGRSATDLTNFDFGAMLAFKLFEWATLNYEIKAFKQPELLDEWQIQNNLLLTFGYSLLD